MTWQDHIRPALDRCPTHTIEDVEDELRANRAQLWELGNSSLITVVAEYPRCRVLRVWLAGGQLDEFVGGLGVLDDLARELDCTRIEIEGRKGWARILTDYKAERVVLTKEVT